MRFLTPELRSVIAKKLTARLDLFFFNLPGNTSTLLSSEEIKILRAVFFSLSGMMYLNPLTAVALHEIARKEHISILQATQKIRYVNEIPPGATSTFQLVHPS